MPPVVVPPDGAPGGDTSGPPPSTSPGPGPGRTSVQRLTLGLEPEDAAALRSDYQSLHEAKELYTYARGKNAPIREEFDTLIDFAMGKQFLTWGNELDHRARPRRNITFDTIRHKKGLVTEPPVNVAVLPRGPDDGGKAQIAKAALDLNAERVDRRDKVDHAESWASIVGTGIVHQGWDPFTGNTAERVVDPRLFDPDPDHITPEDWGYTFETLRMPLDRARAMFPATGDDLVPDGVVDSMRKSRGPWQPNSTAAAVAMKVGSGQEESSGTAPEFVTIVLYYSRGHFKPEGSEDAKLMLRCQLCSGMFTADAPAVDVMPSATPTVPDEPCPSCGYGKLERVVEENGHVIPSYPKGRRLIAFAPACDVLLYKGKWPTDELLDWPYKGVRWYTDPRRWWGLGEVVFQWSLQLLSNKLLVLLAENATANATPKVILPKGIGFENKPWNNIPSEKLIATDPRWIDKVRAFQTGDVGQSLIFLTSFAMRELRAQGGFDDVALGQIKGNTEISGLAIERAQSAAEVPVRDHLRERYKFETRLYRDDYEMIRKRWTVERIVRAGGPSAPEDVQWVKGSDLPEADVLITSDPAELIDRSQRADLGIKLMSAPDPATGQPVLDGEAVAEWVGVPTRILRGVRARRIQSGPTPPTPAAGSGGASPGMGDMNQIAELLSQAGIAGGLNPQLGG